MTADRLVANGDSMSGERGNTSISTFKASGLCTLPQVLRASLGPFGVPVVLVRPHMVPAVTHVTTGPLLLSEDSPSDKDGIPSTSSRLPILR